MRFGEPTHLKSFENEIHSQKRVLALHDVTETDSCAIRLAFAIGKGNANELFGVIDFCCTLILCPGATRYFDSDQLS